MLWTKEMFGVEKPIIALLHLRALPGDPLFGGDMDVVVRQAHEDLIALQDGGVDVKITYRAKSATTLLAPSCVRSDGESNYVYVVEYSGGGFLSQNTMKVKKTSVTVIERSDSTVSIQEDLSYRSIADREDRALEDGATVMEYVQ